MNSTAGSEPLAVVAVAVADAEAGGDAGGEDDWRRWRWMLMLRSW